ncbi:MAG TPA: LamG domain-containing protein, partial [Gammaproteobacteria bacterium]|nr:LamG domain-containing protein [Gammaproteobacteria bacterium]
MSTYRPLFQLLAALALAAGLAACDSGGVGTSSNPNLTTANNGFVYTGAAARNVDVSNFQFYLWKNVIDDSRCGGCHNSQASTPVSPLFFDTSNVNVAYDASIAYVDLTNPLSSAFVAKLNGGHHCWEADTRICGTLIEGWIDNWKNATNGGVASRQINLVPPEDIRDPGEAKSFPATASTAGTNGTSFADTVYPLLVGTNPVIANGNCQNCHEEIATPLAQAPFFASDDVNAAYEAAKAKMDIDTPANSRLVQRLLEQHNCWSDCASNAALMEARIAQYANGIAPTAINPNLVTSKALTLSEGIVASGGSRHETDQFAIWEFKTGTGLTAYDTSGLDPAINLSLIGSVNWVGGYGLAFTGGRAQADTINSDKLYTYIQDTGEYAIEAWVIPSNVSQQDRNIVSYSGGDATRNFTLGQTLYNYESFNRIDTPSTGQANGAPLLTTGDSGLEIAQASLQHVVVNYDPFNGRSVYVNGQLVPGLTDPAGTSTSITGDLWDDGLAFVLGGEIGGSPTRAWAGQVKMVAMHNRVLTPEQIQQNFDVGVGQKFFLLFYVGHHLGEDPADPKSFIVFEVAQYDSFSYLFNKPTFITLDPAGVTSSFPIQGLRIGINGKEALAGQAYANLDV